MQERKMLFTPGPVMTSAALKAAVAHPDMPHRRPSFTRVLHSCRESIKRLLGTDESYGVALVSGSGSAANECALSSLVRPREEVLLVNNGPFGDRLQEILECHGVRVHQQRLRWGELPEVAQVTQALQGNNNIAWLMVVWHETGTGMRNPVRSLCEAAHALGRRTFVDAVSAFGAEDINVLRDHIDVITSVGNKAVGGITGVGFVVAKRESVPALGPDMPRRTMYLSLQNHLQWADQHGQTPNTPAVTSMVALAHALGELEQETLLGRCARVQACARVIRDGARAMGMRILLPEEHSANAVTSIFLPAPVQVDAFIDALDDRGYVVYPGKGPFHDQNMFQIATMGTISPADCQALLPVIQDTLAQMKRAAA